MSRPVIEIRNLSKVYRLGVISATSLKEEFGRLWANKRRKSGLRRDREFWALRDVSFDVQPGDVVGVIGRNGAGKSTLLKILSRITQQTSGQVTLRGRVASLLEVGTGFHPDLTGRENIYLNGAILGMRKAEIARKFDEIVAFAEVDKFIDTPVKRYSSGMYVRLAFAVAAHLEPEILIVDEVLAVGDAQFQKKCLGKMSKVARQGRTVLFVSHNMAAIENLCTKGVLLDKGCLLKSGSVREIIDAYSWTPTANEVYFDGLPISRASVKQVGEFIEISATYCVAGTLAIPCLGFVISDSRGNPICGSNPLQSETGQVEKSSNSGSVKAIVKYPKLLNGSYRLSLWFGDGRQEFFHKEDCLSFEVVNMAGPKQLPASSVGSAAVECSWVFEAQKGL